MTNLPFSSPPLIKAISFTLPAGSNYSLDNVVLALRNFTSTSATPIVQIRDDVGTLDPGSTVLASFINPSPQGTGDFNYTFTPASSFTFTAGTKYWLYVTATAGTNLTWRASSPSITPTGIPGIAINNLRLSTSGSPFSNSSAINTFQINATEIVPPPVGVPEPGTVVALSLFGLGLLGVKGRRNEG